MACQNLLYATPQGLHKPLSTAGTTADAVRDTLFYPIISPRVPISLRVETESFQSTWPVMKAAKVLKMTHLQAIVQEDLRVFPLVVEQMSKAVSKGGYTFSGMY
jgi:hypothetical protein